MSYNPLITPIDSFLLGVRGSGMQPSPGVAVVKANAPRKWQEQSGYAVAGSWLLGGGRGLAHPTATISLVTDDDWTDWASWSQMIKRPSQNQLQVAYDIWHPFLAELDIKSVTIEDVESADLRDETGEYIYTIKFIEFRKPSFALSKPDASKRAQDPDPYEQKIAQLTDQFNQLRAVANQ